MDAAPADRTITNHAAVMATTGSALLVPVLLAILLSGCYSFRGGSAPANLQTVAIPPADDISGFGRGTVRQDLTQSLIRKFRDDNSLRVSDQNGADSRLEATITSIRTERRNISGAELETSRDVIIDVRAVFTDNIKHHDVYKDRVFTGRAQYDINQGATGENRAIHDALEKVTDDILIATVANW